MKARKMFRIIGWLLTGELLSSPLFLPAAMARDSQCGEGLVTEASLDRITKSAIFRKNPPLDSEAMRTLPDAEKQIPISVMLDSGDVIPADSRIVWPYPRTRR